MDTKPEIMLDLETMGVGNSPALIQISAILFDPSTGEEIKSFDEKIDLNSSVEKGLTLTPSTVKWWMTDESISQQTRVEVMSGEKTLTAVLNLFSQWVGSGEVLVWGNGSASDNVWIRSAYDACYLKPPFTFREDMCLRTLRSLAYKNGYVRNFEFEGNRHDALDDCRYQIKDLIEIKRFLNI